MTKISNKISSSQNKKDAQSHRREMMDKKQLDDALAKRPPDGPIIEVGPDGTFSATPQQIRKLLEDTLGDSLGDEE